ncbi:MAG: PAS domain S-box protein [Anaerolineales bacterium]|nr:PAS domain S-box protein [Anaerolineales bacterium]
MKAKTKPSMVSKDKQEHDRSLYLASLVDNISDALISTDMSFIILEWNAGAEALYGWNASEVIGHPLREFVQSEYVDGTTRDSAIKSLVEDGIWKGEVIQNRKDGSHFPVLSSVSQVKDDTGNPVGFVAINRDITERKQVEKQIVQMKRLYATLSQVNQIIVHVKSHKELYQSICDVVLKFGELALAWIGLLDEKTGDIQPVAVSGMGADIVRWPFPVINIYAKTPLNGVIVEAMHTSKAVTSQDVQTDKRTKALHDVVQKFGFHSLATVPFRLREKTIGILVMISVERGIFQAEEELKLFDEMGLDISFALDTMETEAERKQAEEKIRNMAKFPDENPFPVLRISDTGTILYANQSSQPILKEWSTVIGQEVPTFWLKKVEEVLKSRSQQEVDTTISDRTFSLTITPIFNESYVNIYGRDITERKKAEQQLRQSEEKFSKTFRSSPAALLVTRLADGKYLEVNEAYTHIVGYTREELIGHLTTEFNIYLYPEQRQEVIRQLQAKGALYNYEITIQNKYGEHRTVLASLEGINFNNEACLLSSMLDITERKQAEEKIQLQNERLKVLHEIDTAILTSHSLENIIDTALIHVRQLVGCHSVTLTLFDWRANEAEIIGAKGNLETSLQKEAHLPLELFDDLGKTLSQNQQLVITELDEAPSSIPQFQTLLKAGLQSVCILPLYSQWKLIGTFDMFSETRNFFNEESIHLGREVANQVAIAISQNNLIEDLRILNAELEQRVINRTTELNQTNIELEHANRVKSEFLANMSHELRTPLNSILGLSESLLERTRGPLNDSQQEYIQTIESSGQHLLDLINDILDLSKVEAGKLDYYPQTVDVSTLCRSSMAFVREQALRRSVDIVYESNTEDLKIYADARRLKQVLVNLLSNAVKFTSERGQVTLEVRAYPERDTVQFSVSDTGIGITPDNLRKLFQPFVQVDSALNRQFEGTGLGLTLVQRLTDMHGGSVEVESEVGKGSRFTVNIPWGQDAVVQEERIILGLEPIFTKQTHTEEEKSSTHGVILLVEDNETNILTIGEYLQNHGYTIVNAYDGAEAIKKAEETSPDIILMDIQMPVMDGLDATRKLRANPRFATTPIITLTALAMPGDRERCIDAGANEYLSKPVGLKNLKNTIEIWLHKNDIE